MQLKYLLMSMSLSFAFATQLSASDSNDDALERALAQSRMEYEEELRRVQEESQRLYEENASSDEQLRRVQEQSRLDAQEEEQLLFEQAIEESLNYWPQEEAIISEDEIFRAEQDLALPTSCIADLNSKKGKLENRRDAIIQDLDEYKVVQNKKRNLEIAEGRHRQYGGLEVRIDQLKGELDECDEALLEAINVHEQIQILDSEIIEIEQQIIEAENEKYNIIENYGDYLAQ